jgi:hypothetical protein
MRRQPVFQIRRFILILDEMPEIKKLPRPKHYVQKLARNFFAGLIVLLMSMLIGIFGYHAFFRLGWVDSLYNASMILTGMGPVNIAPDNSAKIFASFYAVYSGVAFLSVVAIIFSPVVHRFLHRFRIDVEG